MNELSILQMEEIEGGNKVACAGTLLAVGTGLIITGASGPLGWWAAAGWVTSAAGWIVAGCAG